MDTSAHRQPLSGPAPVKLIAVGVDGNAEGRDAAVLGAMIADASEADLILVAVHPDPVLVPWSGVNWPINWKAMERRADTVLRQLRDDVVPNARTVVETDWSVSRALERVVTREHGDLLVVGSSPDAREGQLRIGNRTRQLLGAARCALAVAPRGLGARARRPIASIGVGYDGGQESSDALSRAGAWALAAGAKLRVPALVDDRLPALRWLESERQRLAVNDQPLDASLRALWDLAEQAASATGANVEIDVAQGSPADALKQLSREVDLLVIGSRRWGSLARVLLGSTGEELMHDAGCAVIVVPRPAR